MKASSALELVVIALLALGGISWLVFTLRSGETAPSVQSQPAGARSGASAAVPAGEIAGRAAPVPDHTVAGAPAAVAAGAASVSAEESPPERSEDITWLLLQLRTAHGFRARTAAALALGRRRGARVEAGLIEALRDEHPSVRTAAASGLSRSTNPVVKEALRAAQGREGDAVAARALGRAQEARPSKPSPIGPAPAARGGLYVSLSKPRAQGALDATLLERADSMARAQAGRLPGARVAPTGESSGAAEAVLRAEGRAGYHLDVTLGVEAVSGGTRATANVLVATYPGRSIKGFAKGAATAGGDPQSWELQRVALEHAIRSAFSDLPRMMQGP